MPQYDLTHLISSIAQRLERRYQTPLTAQQHAWWLVQALTNKSKAQLLLEPTITFKPEQAQLLEQWITAHVEQHEPLQYLLGSVPFADLEILVQPPVLIPRPETEEWTLFVIAQLKKAPATARWSFLDLCTGSGCVGLALARAFTKAQIVASDISLTALELAHKNARHNHLTNISFVHSNLFASLSPTFTFDVIVANPPYISTHEWQTLDVSVTRWEDRNALVADQQGLALIEGIINNAPTYLRFNKQLADLQLFNVVLEIGYAQGQAVHQLMTKRGYQRIIVHKDVSDKDRFVSGYWPADK